MSEAIDIIMLPLARWDSPYSSTAYSLAKEFSKNNRVFYIENPITLKFLAKNIANSDMKRRLPSLLFGRNIFHPLNESGSLVAVTPRLTVPVNFLKPGALYNTLSALNDKLISNALVKLMKAYNVKNYIFINSFNPFYLRSFPAFFKPKLFIYHTVDDISHASHISKHGPYLEDEMIRAADLTFTTSKELRRLKLSVADDIYLLPNAADVSLFKRSLDDNLEKPAEIKDVTMPIVIYTGHIDHRIDFDLLKQCLEQHPDKLFLMVGPTATNITFLNEFDVYKNIRFTGNKDISLLPSYLRYAACAIIPFKCNTLTKSIYPLKVNEYLAAGLPVVATPFSDDIIEFKDVIEIGSHHSGFITSIQRAVQNHTADAKAKRIAVAESNTWPARVKLFWEITNRYLADNSRP